jgi:hypothetical protein
MGLQVRVATPPASQALEATPADWRNYCKGFSTEYKPGVAGESPMGYKTT